MIRKGQDLPSDPGPVTNPTCHTRNPDSRMSEIGDLSLAGLAGAIRQGGISPEEAVEAYLLRIDRLNPALNCFLTVTADLARQSAADSQRRIRSGNPLGPLEGVPVAIKDLLDLEGIPTTNGMEVFRNHVAPCDAETTRRLKAAGAVILGKLNMHEGAMGATNDNPHYGKCHNPWRPGYTPGGSSGGSGAAVGAGLCAGALGTDNMGSIRIPAAFCGVAGLKPSNGLVSTQGMAPLSWSTGCIGPLSRGVEGVAMMMAVLAGYDPACEGSLPAPDLIDYTLPAEPSLKGVKMGVLESIMPEEPPIPEAFQRALKVLETLGAELRPIQIENLANSRKQCLLIIEAEGAVANERLLADPEATLGREVRGLLEFGRGMPAGKLVKAQRCRSALHHRVNQVFEEVSLLLSPVTPTAPFSFERKAPDELAAYMALANLCGLPALSLPMGFNPEGMPLGLQFIGAPFQDAQVLRIGKAYEQATEWHLRLPAPESAA